MNIFPPDVCVRGGLRILPVLFFALLSSGGSQAANVANFDVFNYDYLNDGTSEMVGRLHKPANYDPTKSYPIVVYYHGAGNLGSNNTGPVNEMSTALYNKAVAEEAFIYVPQLPSGSGTWGASAIDNSMRMVAKAAGQYNIDTDRMYVTGYSLGGGGSWIAMSRYHGALAAAAPGAGHISVGEVNPAYLVGKPIWAFHAIDDRTVGVSQPRAVINAIRAADGGKSPLSFRLNANPSNPYYNTGAPYYSSGSGTTFYEENGIRYTEYSSGDHGISGTMYNDANLYPWLFSQRADSSLKPGQNVMFDFGNTPAAAASGGVGSGRMFDSSGRAWNSFNEYRFYRHTGNIVPFAVTTGGVNTSLMLDMTQPFGGFMGTGMAGNPFDAAIGNDSWVTKINATQTSEYAEFLFRGLVPGELYELTIFASTSESDGGRGFMTRYEADGIFTDLQARNNVNNFAVLTNLEADENGNIVLKIYATPGSGSRYGLINTLSIAVVPEPGSVQLLIFTAVGLWVVAARQRKTNRAGA
jgi:poly(3-hydroxybutyrate) depolymerase